MRAPGAALLAAASLLAACQPAERPETGEAFRPAYLGVETRLLEGDLAEFRVAMEGARDGQDVVDYAEQLEAQLGE